MKDIGIEVTCPKKHFETRVRYPAAAYPLWCPICKSRMIKKKNEEE